MKRNKKLILFIILAIISICSLPVQAKNKSIYRALVIGESNYPYSSKLPGSKNDAKAMARVLKKTGYSTVKSSLNTNKSNIYSSINSTFANADTNDVSLFYYSGHACESGILAGSLVTIEKISEKYITPIELSLWLRNIPGTVVVILDCCGSGALINRSSSASDSFDNAIMTAFSETELVARSGELCNSKFQVLTACSKGQVSYEYNKRGVFTERLIKGLGFHYATGSKKSKAPADTNKNKSVTLAECWNYTKKLPRPNIPFSYYPQKPQCYPANSNFILFRR